MRKPLARGTVAILVTALVLLFAPTALAHNFTGSGDCDGWTLVLDGDFGATEIYVDDEPVGLALTYHFPDTSSDESRTFVVSWDKPNNDVTVPHTLTRELNCEQPLIVSATCDTVTIDAAEGVQWAIQIGEGFVGGEGTDSFIGQPGDSWAVYYNNQVIKNGVFEVCGSSETTTTTTVPIDTTTTTVTEESTTTTVITPTTTVTTPSTTLPITRTTIPELTELPFTGPVTPAQALFGLGLGLVLTGLVLVVARREDNA